MSSSVRRIALLHPDRGSITPKMWSGTPWSLVIALRDLGVDVVGIGYDMPRYVTAPTHVVAMATSSGPTAAEHHTLKMRMREIAMRRSIARAGHLDGVVAVGTDAYRLDRLRLTDLVVATYDDATLQTMWSHGDSDTRAAGFVANDVAKWIATQRRSTLAADVACVSTNWAARSFSEDYGVPVERLAVVGMGHRPRGGQSKATEGRTGPEYLFVGVDWKRKNGDAVLRAFAQVRQTYPTAKLHLVGRHGAVVAEGVIDHGLLARDDPEAQRRLDDLYSRATAFVLPSLFDPSPIAYLEAASAGLPVIATLEGGASEMLGEGAIAVPPRDSGAIVAAMLELAHPAEASRRGALGKRAAANATWQAVAARIMAEVERRQPSGRD